MQLPPTVLSVGKKDEKPAKSAKTPISKPAPKETKTPPALVPETKSPAEEDSSDSESSSSSETETEPPEKPNSTPKDPPQKKVKPSGSKDRVPVLRPPRTLETTLFDRLEKMYGSSIKRMLQVQYRFVSASDKRLAMY
jgi:DNA polymerase alpha-associated DNA helicase A